MMKLLLRTSPPTNFHRLVGGTPALITYHRSRA